jgi:hypothetical protein
MDVVPVDQKCTFRRCAQNQKFSLPKAYRKFIFKTKFFAKVVIFTAGVLRPVKWRIFTDV